MFGFSLIIGWISLFLCLNFPNFGKNLANQKKKKKKKQDSRKNLLFNFLDFADCMFGLPGF
jgi:hypothetical protein